MKVLLATGFKTIEQELQSLLAERGDLCFRCYHRQAVIPAVAEYGPDVVVTGPNLDGKEDLYEDVVIPLREIGIRVVFLPGAVDMDDAREWVKKLARWGVYCYVYNTVTAQKIQERIDNPGNPGSLPLNIREAVVDGKIMTKVDDAFDEASRIKNEDNKKQNGFRWLKGRQKEQHKKEQPQKEPQQEPRQESIQETHNNNDTLTETNEYSSKEGFVSNPKKPLTTKTPKISNGFSFIIPSILPKKEQPGAITHDSHHLIAVWNPTGTCKCVTSLNLAVAAARAGLDTVLVELDLFCPMLDIWMGIQQTSIEDFKVNSDQGIGILTLGENIKPEHVSRLLQKTPWGISYLPAGNKLGNVGTPDLTVEQMIEIINALYHRNVKGKPAATVLDLGTSYEYPQTIAALRQANVVLIPLDGSQQESIMAQQQLFELARGGINPRTVELVWHMAGVNKPKPVCNLQLTIPVDLYGYMKASIDRKPYCLISSEGQKVWERVLQEII